MPVSPQTTRTCARCGTPFTAYALEGLCPTCLFSSGLVAQDDAPSSEDQSLNQTGRIFGDYELIEEIARGGMGVVYRARQVSLNRVVAVKMILSGQFAAPDKLARFRAEAQAVAQLHHPNIVAIHEVGEHAGQPFFSMDLVEGRNFAQLVRDEPLPARKAASYLKTIADAVHYAHSRGVLHRDLKPSNILIDDSNQPRITDFGLAKRFASDPRLTTDDPHLTQTGQVLGSPSFIPPEQAAGEKNSLGPASDVYSLGAILYHCLTARPPFVAETMTQTLRMVAEQEPVSPRLLNASVPRDLETICLKCLQKEPQKRYATAQELANDVEHFLRNEPIRARPVSVFGKVHRWCLRNKPLAATGAVIFALLLVVAIGSPIAALRINHERQRAEKSARNAEQAATLASEERAQAEKLAEDNRVNLYAARIKLAEQIIREGGTVPALTLLNSLRPQPGESDLRSFEWYYLWQLCHSERLTVSHKGRVRCVAFSPDGRWFASAGDERIIHLWNSTNGVEVKQLDNDTAGIGAIAFSPDSQRLASGSVDANVRIWDLATGNQLQTLRLGTNPITALAYSRDGRHLAAGEGQMGNGSGNPFTAYLPTTSAGRVVVWNTETCTVESDVQTSIHGIRAVAFSMDGRKFFSCGDNYQVTLHELASGQKLAVQTNFPGPVIGLAVSPDNRTVVAASWFPYSQSGRITVLDVETLAQKQVLTTDAGRMLCLAMSPDGTKLASGGLDQVVRLWDSATGTELMGFYGHQGDIAQVAFAPDGRTLASAAWDSTVRLWDLESNSVRQQIPTPESFSVAFSPDGKTLVSSGRSLEVRDAKNGGLIRSITDYSNGDVRVAFSPDGSVVAATDVDDNLNFWDTTTWRQWSPSRSQWPQQTNLVEPPFEPDAHLCFSPDGRTLAMGNNDRVVRLWDVGNKKLMDSIPVWSNLVFSVAFTPDGQTLLATTGSQIGFWDLAQRRLKATLTIQGGLLRISPDGHWLAIADFNRMRIWELPSLKLHAKMSGHNSQIYGLAFSHDGRVLASASWDGTVKIWHVLSGQELLSIPSLGGVVWSVAFSPDDRALAFGSGSNIKGSGMVTILRGATDAAATIGQKIERPPVPFKGRILSVIPPRPADCPANLLEISSFFNATLTNTWTAVSASPNDLSSLPSGLQTFGGVSFDVRGIIQLGCAQPGLAYDYPAAVGNIPVRQRARALHFLHAAAWYEDWGVVVGEYIIHYADHTEERVPLIYGQNVRDWFSYADIPQILGPETRSVWQGANSHSKRYNQELRLYDFRWQNPHPQIEIESLDFKSSLTMSGPFLLAITVEGP